MAYDPTNGESPLTTAPIWGGTGGGSQAQKVYAYQKFQQLFGRAPTQSELDTLAPAYGSGDQNIANNSQGDLAVAQYFQNQSNTPDQIAKANQDKYLKEAPQHFDSVSQQFKSVLGRDPTQDELNHFGSAIASGSLDPYSLQTFLQQQPEAQTKQNTQFQNDLSGKLASSDQQYFSNSILPSLQEAYAKQGRSFDSSAFQNAATNSAQQQNVQRQQYIAGLSAQQYGGVQDRAYQDYAAQVANQNQLTNSGINAQYAGMQNTQNRTNQISDFNTQAQMYQQYLARYGKRNNGLGGLIGGIAGAGLGALSLTNPATAPFAGQFISAGYGVGSGIGQGAQNYAGGSY